MKHVTVRIEGQKIDRFSLSKWLYITIVDDVYYWKESGMGRWGTNVKTEIALSNCNRYMAPRELWLTKKEFEDGLKHYYIKLLMPQWTLFVDDEKMETNPKHLLPADWGRLVLMHQNFQVDIS